MRDACRLTGGLVLLHGDKGWATVFWFATGQGGPESQNKPGHEQRLRALRGIDTVIADDGRNRAAKPKPTVMR